MGKKKRNNQNNYWDDEPNEPVQPIQVAEEETYSPKASGKKGKKGKKGKNITHNGFSTGAFGVLGGGDEDDSMCQELNSSDVVVNAKISDESGFPRISNETERDDNDHEQNEYEETEILQTGFGSQCNGLQESEFDGSKQKGFGGSRQSGFGGSQQNDFGGSQQNSFGGLQQNGYGGSQQNVFGGSQQDGFGGSHRSGFGGSQQNGFGGSQTCHDLQENSFGGSRQSGFACSKQSEFGGSRQDGFGASHTNHNAQDNTFGGSQKNCFGGSQQSGFASSKKSVNGSQSIHDLNDNGFGGSRQSGFGGSKQSGFGGSQSVSVLQEKKFGGSKPSGFGGSVQSGFGGSKQSGFGGSQSVSVLQENEFGGSKPGGFGGSVQSGFGSSKQSGFGGSQTMNVLHDNGFNGSKQNGFGGSRQSGFGGSKQSGFGGSQTMNSLHDDAFGGSKQSGFGGSRQSGFGGSQTMNLLQENGFTGSKQSGLGGSKQSGFGGSQSVHDLQENRFAGSTQSGFGDSTKQQNSRSRLNSTHFDNEVEKDNFRGSHISVNSRTSERVTYDQEFGSNAYSTQSLSVCGNSNNRYNEGLEKFNKIIENRDELYGSCRLKGEKEVQANRGYSKSIHTMNLDGYGPDFNPDECIRGDFNSRCSRSNKRNGSCIDGDDVEDGDGFSEQQVTIRTMVNDEKFINHRLSKLSINTNADEFVLVGGQPPPDVVDGRASCPAGRNRSRKSIMRSTDFLAGQDDGNSYNRSISALSRQSLISTNENDRICRGIEEESLNKDEDRVNREYSNEYITASCKSGVPSRTASSNSVNNFVTANEEFQEENLNYLVDDFSRSNGEVNENVEYDENNNESKLFNKNSYATNKFSSSGHLGSELKISVDNFSENIIKSREPSQINLYANEETETFRKSRTTSHRESGEIYIPFNSEQQNIRTSSRASLRDDFHMGSGNSYSNSQRSVASHSFKPQSKATSTMSIKSLKQTSDPSEVVESNCRSRTTSRQSVMSANDYRNQEPRSRTPSVVSVHSEKEIFIPTEEELLRSRAASTFSMKSSDEVFLDNHEIRSRVPSINEFHDDVDLPATRSRTNSNISQRSRGEIVIPTEENFERQNSDYFGSQNTQGRKRTFSQKSGSISTGKKSGILSTAASRNSVHRDYGDDTEENLLIADYNSKLESHWNIADSENTSEDQGHYHNIPTIVGQNPNNEINRSNLNRTPPSLRKARMRSKSSVDIGYKEPVINEEVPRPLIFTDALTPQSIAPRSRIQKQIKNCNEIAIQTGETIRIRQMADFSNYESSTDFQCEKYDIPPKSNPLPTKSLSSHPAAAVLSNFLQQQQSNLNSSRITHHDTIIHNEDSLRSVHKEMSSRRNYENKQDSLPKSSIGSKLAGAVEIVPKEVVAEMRDQIIAESKLPQTPTGSRIDKNKFDEFERNSSREDENSKDRKNTTSQSSVSNNSSSYRWIVNDPRSETKRAPDVKWSDGKNREPGFTVRQNVKAGKIRDLASMFNDIQNKAQEPMLKTKSSLTKNQNSNNSGILEYPQKSNHEDHQYSINSPYNQMDGSKCVSTERKYYPISSNIDRHKNCWYYSNDLEDALLDVEESGRESMVDRYRTSTPVNEYYDRENIANQFQRIPSIRSEDPLKHTSSIQRSATKNLTATFEKAGNNLHYISRRNSSLAPPNPTNQYAQINKKNTRRCDDYAEIHYSSDSNANCRLDSMDRNNNSRKTINDYEGDYGRLYHQGSDALLSRKSSRGSEQYTGVGSHKSRFDDIIEETVNDHIDSLFGFVDEQSRHEQKTPSTKPSLHYSISGYRAMQKSNKYGHDEVRFSPSVAPNVSELAECSMSLLKKRDSSVSNSMYHQPPRFGGRPADLVASTPKSSPTHRLPPALEESYISSISEGSRHEERMVEYKNHFNKLFHQTKVCEEMIDMTQKVLLKARKERKPMEELTAQRSILITTERLLLLRRELQNIQAVFQQKRHPPPINNDLRGSMSIANITLYLNRLVSHKAGDSSSFAFVVLLKSGCELEATAPVTLLFNHLNNLKLHFAEKICFNNLPIDFRIKLEVYAMVLPETRNDENSCATTIANKCRNLLGPGRKHHSSSGLPVGEFVKCGFLHLTRETTMSDKFYLDDAQYPLEGTIGVTSICSSLPPAIEVDFRGFLTMYQTVGGTGSWERYWAVLRCGSIYFWKYPEDDHIGRPPKAHLQLQSCTKDVIIPCSLDQCARPYTFSIELLVSSLPSMINRKKIVLAADTRELMCSWIDAINETLGVIRE